MFELGNLSKDINASFKELFEMIESDGSAFIDTTGRLGKDWYVKEYAGYFERFYNLGKDHLLGLRKEMEDWDDNRPDKDHFIQQFHSAIVDRLNQASLCIKECETKFSTETIRGLVDFFVNFFVAVDFGLTGVYVVLEGSHRYRERIGEWTSTRQWIIKYCTRAARSMRQISPKASHRFIYNRLISIANDLRNKPKRKELIEEIAALFQN